MGYIDLFWESFLPFFIAFDVIGLLPIYLSLTATMERNELRRVSAIAVCATFGICLFFGLCGQFLMSKLGITLPDFQIAGGLLLIALSIMDSQASEKTRRRPDSYVQLAVVPITMPLLVGPAVLTTLLLSLNTAGAVITSLALILNLGIVFLTFHYATLIASWIGQAGAKGIGKFFSILLCAIGVMFIRKGLVAIITALP